MSNLHTTSPALSYFSHDQFLAIFACPILDTACPRRIRRRIHTERLVYPTASRHDPTDILASRDFALEPSPSPRSLTVSGYVAERGSAVGTASPRLVYSRALISPRRVPSPRDLGPDAHAHSEISVAAGSSTSAVVVGEQLCRTLSASGNAGHPDTSRDFPDEQTIPRPTPTNAPLCVAFLAGIRRPRHYTRRVIRWQQAPRDDEHDTHMRRQRCPRAPLCGASHAGDGNYQEMYASTTTTYCAAGSMRGSLESCFPTLAPPLLRHALPRDVTKSPSFALGNRHHAGRRAADRAGSLAQGRRVRSVQAATRVITGEPKPFEMRTRSKRRMRYLRIPTTRRVARSAARCELALASSHAARRRTRSRPRRASGSTSDDAGSFWGTHAPLKALGRMPRPCASFGTFRPICAVRPRPQSWSAILYLRFLLKDRSWGRATGSAKRCPSFDSPSDFSCCFRASTRRRDSPTSPRVFLKRGGSVDSPFQGEILFLCVPDVYDVLRVSSVGAPCSATRWHRIRASRARERPPSASPWLSQRSESKIAPSRAIPPCFELQIA
ncbi:hypothetical protein GGG16DRAFT_106943, partial [Schizophyllum commune]